MEAGPHIRVKHGCESAAVKHQTPAPAASRVPAALLADLALISDPAVGVCAHAPEGHDPAQLQAVAFGGLLAVGAAQLQESARRR